MIISVKTEEQDLLRDVGMKFMVEDFEEEQRIMFWTSSWVLGKMRSEGYPWKNGQLAVGEEMAILEAILAFMDCILEWKKAEKVWESLFFLITSGKAAVEVVQ